MQTARTVLEQTPPELAADVIDHGIVLTGGGAKLRHLDDLLLSDIGVPVPVPVPVPVAEEPDRCVAKGAGAALDYLDVVSRSIPTEEESLIAESP